MALKVKKQTAQPKTTHAPGWPYSAAFGPGSLASRFKAGQDAAKAGVTSTADGSFTPAGVATGPPVDQNLVEQQAAANRDLGLGGAWDIYKTGQVNASYGNLDNPSADAVSNPYSQAALAYKRYNESRSGSLNSYAGQGQLYSGALQNAQEANASNYSQGLSGLRQSKQGQLDDITKGSLDRYSQVGATLNQDALASLMKALGLS